MTDFGTVFLAPLAGVSDKSFRLICSGMGADLTYTEMISAKGLYYGNARTIELADTLPEEKTVGVQIFGSEPGVMAYAAKILQDYLRGKAALIDINMGCPVNKVVKTGAGSALMLDEDSTVEMVKAVIENDVNKRICSIAASDDKSRK